MRLFDDLKCSRFVVVACELDDRVEHYPGKGKFSIHECDRAAGLAFQRDRFDFKFVAKCLERVDVTAGYSSQKKCFRRPYARNTVWKFGRRSAFNGRFHFRSSHFTHPVFTLNSRDPVIELNFFIVHVLILAAA